MSVNYFSRSIAKESIWIRPTEIGGLPDDKKHSVCFNKNLSKVYLFSEPRRLNPQFKFSPDTFREDMRHLASGNGYSEYSEENWHELYEQLICIAKDHKLDGAESIAELLNKEKNIVAKTAKLSFLAFGVYMAII